MFSSVLFCLYLVYVYCVLFKTNLAIPHPISSSAQYSVMKLIAHFLFLLSDLHILSFNTQGLQGLNKRTDVLEFLKNKKYQIYCLQDTHFTEEEVEKLKDQ